MIAQHYVLREQVLRHVAQRQPTHRVALVHGKPHRRHERLQFHTLLLAELASARGRLGRRPVVILACDVPRDEGEPPMRLKAERGVDSH